MQSNLSQLDIAYGRTSSIPTAPYELVVSWPSPVRRTAIPESFEATEVWTHTRPSAGSLELPIDPADNGSSLETSSYDWSDIDPVWRQAGIFPVIAEESLKATLGILDRTVRRGYPR